MVFRSWKTLLATWVVGGFYVWGAVAGPAPVKDMLTLGRNRNRHHGNVSTRAKDKPIASSSLTPVPTTIPGVTTPAPVAGNSGTNPFVNEKLYIDPENPASRQAKTWRSSRPADAALMDKIGNQSVAMWLGSWQNNIGQAVTENLASMKAQGALPVFVVYNIPNRDCGSYSAGGARSPAAYQAWINSIQAASANTKSVFLLEPDALPGWDCLTTAQRAERSGLLRDAITTLTSSPNHYVYLDAGNTKWQSAAEIATRLANVGTAKLTGITLNVSNFLTTTETKSYGDAISSLTNGLHVVIDTSRNGQGPAPDLNWCNPAGRGLGETPKATPNSGDLDAILWVKYPGESDGSCNGAPEAGVWMPEYALGLAQRAAF